MNTTTPSVNVRRATARDVEDVVRLINAGGPEGTPRQQLPDVLPDSYARAFEAIDADPNQLLMVVERDGNVIGTFQMTFLTHLAGAGRPDAQIEAIHVAEPHRSQGIGTVMLQWAVQEATRRECRRIQLTTDKRRTEAHAFYKRLGFVFSHEGAKLHL